MEKLEKGLSLWVKKPVDLAQVGTGLEPHLAREQDLHTHLLVAARHKHVAPLFKINK